MAKIEFLILMMNWVASKCHIYQQNMRPAETTMNYSSSSGYIHTVFVRQHTIEIVLD